jgi:signal transduction histidine kinase
VTSTDAVGSLARRFNEMAERNQQLLEAQRATLQAVSHELRTPTARIRFGLEMLAGAKDAAQAEARLRSIDEDLNEVDHLVTELLELNRSEAPSGQIREPIPVRQTLEDMADKIRELAPTLTIRVDAPPDLMVPAAAHLFRRAIRNLLTNAVRYARTRVTMTARQAGGQVEIVVEDDGPGIPAEQRVRVLEPFARLDDSRSRDTGGVGLGLAIVARVLASHGGHVEVGDAPCGGAQLRTVWPAR